MFKASEIGLERLISEALNLFGGSGEALHPQANQLSLFQPEGSLGAYVGRR